MKRHLVGFMLICAVFSAFTSASADNSGTEDARSRLDSPGRLVLGASGGEGLEVYHVNALWAAWRTRHTMAFVNTKGTFLRDEDQELGLGLGLRRKLRDRPVIMGVNSHYDTRWTAAGNIFAQASGGAELFTRWMDFRANYYYPLTDPRILGEYEESETTTSADRIVTTITRYREVEEALQGYDFEAGAWLPLISRLAPTAVYIGYQKFEAGDYQSAMEGATARIESRPHPNVTLDVEWFEISEPNRSDYFAGIRLNLPLDFMRGVRFDRREGMAGGVRAFESRMYDPVGRLLRVRTVLPEPAVVSSTQHETVVHRRRVTPPPPPPPLDGSWDD